HIQQLDSALSTVAWCKSWCKDWCKSAVAGGRSLANVLLHDSRADSRGFTAMLTDFGLAQFVSGAKHYCKNAGGTTAYMAPELFMDGELSRSSDVYAYGILLYEMVHGKAAYDKQHQQQVLVSVMHGFRPQWQAPDEGQLPGLRALYLRCVDEDPDARPTATDLVAQLGRLEEAARLESRLESQETPRASR
ncbi:hypothetical protein QJQ45_028605, partial [Haematococcus lacustris]